MPKNVYGAYVLIGGGAGALDAIDGADLADLDTAFVVTASLCYTYSLDADSAVGESSPAIISPDANAGDKRWILVGVSSTNPISGDGTAGRIMRLIRLRIDNGTNAQTLKCTIISYWNGDAIALTDNISKGATTGHFILSADGKELRVEAAGLSGNVIATVAFIATNLCGTDLSNYALAANNDISVACFNSTTGTQLDITTLVDTGRIDLQVLYITDA